MARSLELEQAIVEAFEAATDEDYDLVLRRLAFAFTRAGNLRQAVDAGRIGLRIVDPRSMNER